MTHYHYDALPTPLSPALRNTHRDRGKKDREEEEEDIIIRRGRDVGPTCGYGGSVWGPEQEKLHVGADPCDDVPSFELIMQCNGDLIISACSFLNPLIKHSTTQPEVYIFIN